MLNVKVLDIIIQLAVVLFAISIHEASHGWMAEKFGDPTARMQGRVTLNPIAHIDPIGTIIFPLVLTIIGAPVFGWAKPVLVNPHFLRNRRRAGIFISAAGPLSNIIVASIGIMLFLIIKLIDIRILLSISGPKVVGIILIYLIFINIFLAIFNLIPVPPLDGGGILEGFLKGEAYYAYQRVKPFGIILLFIIIYTGALNVIARPIQIFIFRILGA